MSLSDKAEVAAIDEEIKETGARPIEARAAAIKAFWAGEFSSESVHSWLAVQAAERPELFGTHDTENADLMAEAFLKQSTADEGHACAGDRRRRRARSGARVGIERLARLQKGREARRRPRRQQGKESESRQHMERGGMVNHQTRFGGEGHGC